MSRLSSTSTSPHGEVACTDQDLKWTLRVDDELLDG
jgi:hypothetical protein